MGKILVQEIMKTKKRSCNNCSARNYESKLCYDGNIVDKLYDLQISIMSICLCEKCLREVSTQIDGLLNEKNESEEAE